MPEGTDQNHSNEIAIRKHGGYADFQTRSKRTIT